MSTDVNHQNIATVKSFLNLQYEGKIEEAFETHASSEFTWVVSTGANKELNDVIPWAGVKWKGLEGYKKLTSLLFGEFEPLEFSPTDFHAVENFVFMVGHFTFKHRITGKIAKSDFLGLFRMKDGKIQGGQFYENTYAVAEARML